LVVEIDGPPLLFPPAEPAAASRIWTASRRLHRHYRMRRKRRAARRRPPSGGPQFNVRTLGRRDWPARSRSAPTLCERDVAASRKHLTLTKSLEWPEKNGEKSV